MWAVGTTAVLTSVAPPLLDSWSNSTSVCAMRAEISAGTTELVNVRNVLNKFKKSHQVKLLSSGDFVFSTHFINKYFHVSVFPTEDNWTLGLLFFLFTATNICQSWGICQQTCEKLPQGHKCGCHEGFHLEPDGFTCRPLGKCCQCWTNCYISHLSILVFQLYSI